MNHQFHIEIARQRADELHRAAAMSRLAGARPRRERLIDAAPGAFARRVRARRSAPELVS